MSIDDENNREGSFLKRWSSRKSDVSVETDVRGKSDASPQPEIEDEVTPIEVDTLPAKVLTDKDMPPIESLHEGSDFSGFMSEGVSAVLRKAALKKLFAQPVFNIRDGLNDYDEDYTTFAPLGDTVPVEMRHRAEIDAKREALKQARLEEEENARVAVAADPALEEGEDEPEPVLSIEENLELTHEQESLNDPSK